MKSFCVIMVRFSGVIRIELSAAITPCTIRHHCVMPHGRLSPYIKKNLHTHMRASAQWCCAEPIRRYYAAPHGGLSPNKSKKEK